MNHILAVGFVFALMAAAILVRGGCRMPGDAALAVLMACIAVHFGIKFSIYTAVSDDAVRHQMNTCIGFCYGPLLLIYTDQVRGRAMGLRRWYLFVPFLLALVGYLTVISVLTVSAEIGHSILRRYNASTWLLIPAMNGACAVAVIRGSVRSGRDGWRLGMLLLAGCVVPTFLSLVQTLAPRIPELATRSAAYVIIAAMPAVLIFTRAVTQPEAVPRPEPEPFAPAKQADKAPDIALDGSPDAVKLNTIKPLTIDELDAQQRLLENVERYLAQDGVLADPELNLERLAAGVGVTRHQLSEMLNAFANERFYDFISARRVQCVTGKMDEMQRLGLPVNVLILAYDAGFKAKSSFNAAFRKFTGMTPTAYLVRSRDAVAPAEA